MNSSRRNDHFVSNDYVDMQRSDQQRHSHNQFSRCETLQKEHSENVFIIRVLRQRRRSTKRLLSPNTFSHMRPGCARTYMSQRVCVCVCMCADSGLAILLAYSPCNMYSNAKQKYSDRYYIIADEERKIAELARTTDRTLAIALCVCGAVGAGKCLQSRSVL